jgi:UDP-N-acetylmuramyl-tripeptide synthetase
MFKRLIKKILPKKFINFYHYCLAQFAAWFYNYPAKKMIVIGVTGTKGKSTVCYLLAKILEEAGEKVGMISTILFKIGFEERLNDKKMTMPGRFFLQKMLWKMLRAGCAYAIIETSSEGIAQYRHIGIDYDVAVFTNLTPEHIESHGSFENYKKAKLELFKNLKIYNLSKRVRGEIIPKIFVVNFDDAHAKDFLSYPADKKVCYRLAPSTIETNLTSVDKNEEETQNSSTFTFCDETYIAENIELGRNYSKFIFKRLNGNKINSYRFEGDVVKLNLIGEVNVKNALAAISTALALGIPFRFAKSALEKIQAIPGRFEIVIKEPFTLMVDYAHEPASFIELYKTVKLLPKNRVIHVFGATGGGRDKMRAPKMGQIAAQYADIIILTTDDPYFDNPEILTKNILNGILDYTKEHPIRRSVKVLQVIDRREAIRTAIKIASEGDLILLTGKGAEQAMVVGEKKIKWDDREVVKEIFNEFVIEKK